ncbi:rhodanese-like domain-containing protein [Desulfamplus magnetovallimortis]|uniref:rhodanese-like domain-containing protein n=1 Tax=Desulfamplus magnetovallimortis TaxID=1246637 RepID=UPI0009B9BD7A|nr:rhodanese-like domain-containing protein [Desulfamplus magnetovallimortis]
MRWKQFLTPVKSLDAEATRKLIDENSEEQFTLLDVRQPGEYEHGHLPGAKLIPLPDLPDRLAELDPEKTQIVYCAVGGRSRVAAQMLAGKGFDRVINMSGGFKAWKDKSAIGSETQGMSLFTGSETALDTLKIAYSLEQGLREFYLAMIDKIENEAAKKLFKQLADIEVKHQDHIYAHYLELADNPAPRDKFEAEITSDAMEGGLTSDEYAQRFNPDWESPVDIISLAMSIEAQALDMYTRAAQNADKDEDSRKVLSQIAREEKTHLAELGKLMDKIA